VVRYVANWDKESAEYAIALAYAWQGRGLVYAMMKMLIDDTYIVVPLAGAYRIYGMSSKVNLSDPHPSNTNQTWFSLTKTK